MSTQMCLLCFVFIYMLFIFLGGIIMEENRNTEVDLDDLIFEEDDGGPSER